MWAATMICMNACTANGVMSLADGNYAYAVVRFLLAIANGIATYRLLKDKFHG